MKKTIGGDRLGSGKRMKFDTKTFNRSTHNLGEIFRSTMSAGTLVPCLVLPILPGDTIDIETDGDIRTLPTIGPMFGSYKFQVDYFQIPMRLYNRDLQMNKLEIGRNMENVQFPLIEIKANDINLGLLYEYSKDTPYGGKEISNAQIEPSTIFSYLGIKGLGGQNSAGIVTREFNMTTWLMYWDIVKQYYSNKMEDDAYYIHNSLLKQDDLINQIIVGTGTVGFQTEMETGTSEVININSQFYMILSFASAENFNAFLEEEFTAKLTFTFGGQNYTQIKKGEIDWVIQRNTSQNKIYFTLRDFPFAYTIATTVLLNSDITYDYIRPNLSKFELKNIDVMRELIMNKSGLDPLILDEDFDAIEPYTTILGGVKGAGGGFYEITNLQCKQEGLAVKTYQSDIFNNWLNTEWIDGGNGVNAVTAIQVDENGRFTLDEFNIKKKVYDMLNHIALAGGTYDDWQDVIWNVERARQINSPVFEGGLSKEIIFQEVISNSASNEQGEQPLGTLAGRGTLSNKHKGGKVIVKCTEPAYIIGIASITPRIDYSNGNMWYTNLRNMSELHNPYLDGIGFQDLVTDQIAYWDTKTTAGPNYTPTFKSAGKQPSWINYQTSFNKVYGNFALENEQMFMVLNRRYETELTGEGFKIGDLTTYIDPMKYNHIFADTSPDAMNFWVQISHEITARRVMSANQIPNL